MNCNFCDASLAAGANFCSRCGNGIGTVQPGRLPQARSDERDNFSLGSIMRQGLATRVVISTVAYGLLGLWAGSIIPLVDATTLGMLGAAYGALRKI